MRTTLRLATLSLLLALDSASTFFLPPAPLLAPPTPTHAFVRRLLHQHVHAEHMHAHPPNATTPAIHPPAPLITALLRQLDDLHGRLAEDRDYLYSLLPPGGTVYPSPFPPALHARVQDGLAQLNWLAVRFYF